MRRAVCLFVSLTVFLTLPTSANAAVRQTVNPSNGQTGNPSNGRTANPSNRQTDLELESRTAAVASTLRCPVCQGESIQDSPSELAQQMRAIVKERLRSGETPAQIQSYFVARYGEWILLEPRATGLNILLYALPVALVVGGLIVVTVLVKRWTAPEASVNES